MALNQPVIGPLFVARPIVFHAVLLGESLHLPVAEHGKAGKGGHHGRDTEALVAFAELVNRRFFIGIAHEVHVTLHDIGIELEGVLDDRAILGIVFIAQHHHEGAVVDAVHAQGADEVALHEPESLCEEQRSWDFGGDTVDDLAPEFVGHRPVEIGLAHAVFGARRDGPARTGSWEPQAMEVALGEGHRGIEANDGKQARDMEDGLNDLLAHRRIEVIELRSVVPRKAGAVVAVIDVAGLAGRLVAAAEDDCRVFLGEIAILDFDLHAAVGGDIGALEAIDRIRRLPAGDEPLGVFNHPGRVDAHMVGNHVAGQPDAVVVGAVAKVDVRRFAAQVLGDTVVEERIGRRDGVLVSAQQLDGFRSPTALPDADQPQRVHAAIGECLEFFAGDVVEAADVAPIEPAELREPHVGALRNHDGSRHPGGVGR